MQYRDSSRLEDGNGSLVQREIVASSRELDVPGLAIARVWRPSYKDHDATLVMKHRAVAHAKEALFFQPTIEKQPVTVNRKESIDKLSKMTGTERSSLFKELISEPGLPVLYPYGLFLLMPSFDVRPFKRTRSGAVISFTTRNEIPLNTGA
jgi:hypothetical protein